MVIIDVGISSIGWVEPVTIFPGIRHTVPVGVLVNGIILVGTNIKCDNVIKIPVYRTRCPFDVCGNRRDISTPVDAWGIVTKMEIGSVYKQRLISDIADTARIWCCARVIHRAIRII